MKTPKMRRYITRYILGLVVLVVLIYGSLMNRNLIKGLHVGGGFDVELTAFLFAEKYETDPGAPLPEEWLISSYLGLESLPEKYKELFPVAEYEHWNLMLEDEHPEAPEGEEGDFILFLPYRLHDGKWFFVVKTYPAEYMDIPTLGDEDLEWLFSMSLPLGIACVLFFFFAVRHMLKKLYLPVNALTRWARKMDRKALLAPVPDFGYEEVNQLAGLLHGSMKERSEALEREECFLRNASHELRTPIAILQSNMELLDRIRPDVHGAEKMPLERIRRAVSNMSHLIETLLWLGMDDRRIPDPEPLDLVAMVRDLVGESRYVLEQKSVEVDLSLKPVQVHAVYHAAYIVVGNLIRNAFQYTLKGRVTIEVAGSAVTVTNVNSTREKVQEIGKDYGFGLGLVLVEQITGKLGWQYENQVIPGGQRAELVFRGTCRGRSTARRDGPPES